MASDSIRIARKTDISAMLEIYRPYVEKTAYSFEYEVPDQKEFEKRFEAHIVQCPWLVWERDQRVIGYAYAGRAFVRAAYQWCAEIAIYIDADFHGYGMGRKLYGKLEKILERQGYEVIYAVITTENQDSVEFHKKMGYQVTATFPRCGYKLGRWHGVIWMEKRIGKEDNPTRFPRPWIEM